MKRIILPFIALTLSLSAGAATGFHTAGQKLLDANGKEFVIRGCNYSYAWQRGHEQTVIPAAKRIGCNAIRIQLSNGGKWQKCSYGDLEKLIRLCEENKLIAVFNTHDETGSNSISDLMNSVNYWIEMKDLLNAHTATVIVNISNEWCGNWDSSIWADGYKQAISKLRSAGLKNTLMVDAAGWGQYPQCVAMRGTEVAQTDPDSNVVFSVHIYQDAGKNDERAKLSMDYAMSAGVPAIVGEFAYFHQGENVAYQKVMDYCAEKNMGYMVWSWTGNGSGAESCDMFGSYDDSQWKTNGEKTVKGSNGIQATSKECSVFGEKVPDTGDDDPELTEGDEVVILTPNQYFSNWDQEPVNIPASKFANATDSDELRIYYTASHGAEIQLAYTDLNNNWTETVPYKTIVGNGYEKQSLASLVPYVKRTGFFVKGHDYTFVKATIYNPRGTARVECIGSEDEKLPTDIYTLEGIRVAEMQPGKLYIVKQGNKCTKILYR